MKLVAHVDEKKKSFIFSNKKKKKEEVSRDQYTS